MTRKFSSISVETTLASGISNSATTMTVATGTGSALLGGVTLAAGNVDQFTVAIDPDTQSEEIVFITAVSSDTFTIVRGCAGTSAITHSGGATVKHVLTSDDLNFFTTGVATADAAVPKSTVTTKGDLIAATGSGAVTRVPVGTNGYALVADSTATAGVAYSPMVTNLDLTINAQTGTTYTLALTDKNDLVTLSNASPIALTVPTNASVAFPVGSQVNIAQIGAGQVTVAGDAGVTVNATPGLKLRAQYSTATLVKTGTNSWLLIGDVSA